VSQAEPFEGIRQHRNKGRLDEADLGNLLFDDLLRAVWLGYSDDPERDCGRAILDWR